MAAHLLTHHIRYTDEKCVRIPTAGLPKAVWVDHMIKRRGGSQSPVLILNRLETFRHSCAAAAWQNITGI